MKCAYQKFNQVDLYQSQQWLNGTGQKGGGIVGITKTPSPSSRWALFNNTLSNIATEHEKCFAQILTTPSLTTNATDNVDENWRSQEIKTSSHSHHCESFRDRKGSIAQPCWIRWPHGVWFDLFLGRRQPEIVLESFPAVPRSAKSLGTSDLIGERVRSSTTHPEMQNSSFAKSTVRKTVMLSTWPSQSRFAETVHQKLCPQQEVNTFHIKRPHCQAAVWQQVHLHQPQLPPTETMGWGLENSMLVPVLKSLPSVSDTCADFIFCCWTKQCTSVPL